MCEVGPPYRTTYVSPQTEALFGYSAKEWLEDPDFYPRIVHPDDLDKIIALDQAAVQSSGFARSVYRLIDHRGTIRWVRDESVLVRDPAGQPIEVVRAVRDDIRAHIQQLLTDLSSDAQRS